MTFKPDLALTSGWPDVTFSYGDNTPNTNDYAQDFSLKPISISMCATIDSYAHDIEKFRFEHEDGTFSIIGANGACNNGANDDYHNLPARLIGFKVDVNYDAS